MATILVRPAKGLLVPYAPHRPGQFIGVKRAPADAKAEDIHARVDGGHSYVATDPVRVETCAQYARAVQRKELELVDEAEWQAELDARAAAAAEPTIVAGDPDLDGADEAEESAS